MRLITGSLCSALLCAATSVRAADTAPSSPIIAERAGNWEAVLSGNGIVLRSISGEAILGITPAENALYLLASTPVGGGPATVDFGNGQTFVLSPEFLEGAPKFKVLIADTQSQAFVHVLTSGRVATITVGSASYSISLAGSSSAIEALAFFGKEHDLDLPPPFSTPSNASDARGVTDSNSAATQSQSNGEADYILKFVDTKADGELVSDFKSLHPFADCNGNFCDGFNDPGLCPAVGFCGSFDLVISGDHIGGWKADFAPADWSKSLEGMRSHFGPAVEQYRGRSGLIPMDIHTWSYKLPERKTLTYTRFTGKDVHGNALNTFEIMLDPAEDHS